MSFKDKFDEVTDRAADRAAELTTRARALAGEHNDRIDDKLDRAAGFLNDKTGGKYSERIEGGISRAKQGIDRFAEGGESPDTDTAPPADGR